ncbi:hypothetical integral membrane protein, partial [Pseudomonas savastanoi pv. glycinea str. race 4]
RLAATALALWLIVPFRERALLGSVPLRSKMPLFAILSVLGFSLYFICSFGALKSLKASDLTMVLATIPGITYLLGLLSRSLGFSWLRLSGVVIVSAAALAFNASSNEGGAVSPAGVALALMAALSYAFYGLLSKRYLKELPLLTSLAWITTISAASFLPLFILDPQPLFSLSPEDVFKVLILGAACSAPVYVLYQKVLAEGGVLYANAIGLLAPFAVVGGEWLIGTGAALSGMKIVAMIAVMLGISLLFVDASYVSRWQP